MITLYKHKLKDKKNLRKRKYTYHLQADKTGIDIIMFRPCKRCHPRFPYAEFLHFLKHEVLHMILDEKFGDDVTRALDNIEGTKKPWVIS